jgi:albumin D box-binding protein
MAAKRSRDARRLKETEVSMRASFLESENLLLKRQLDEYKQENKVLKVKIARYERKK